MRIRVVVGEIAAIVRGPLRLRVNHVWRRPLARHHALRLDDVDVVHVYLDVVLDVLNAWGVIVVTTLAHEFIEHLLAD